MSEDNPAAPGKKKAASKGKTFSSIQGILFCLLLLTLVPILLAQTYFSYDRYQSRKGIESEANLGLARATAKAFDTFVQEVLHQELTIGLAFTSSQTLSDKEKRRILFENQAGNPAIWHLFWENPAGIVTAATGSQFIGMDLSDREYYREIVAGKEWVVSDLILSKTTQQPSFTISRGVRNERGELLGIIVAGILPAKLDRVLAVERPGDAGVSLLDSKGMLSYRYPATQYTWEQRNWLKHYPMIGEVLKGKEVVTNVASDRTGLNRIVAFTPVPSIGWIVASSRAEEEVVRPIISATLQETGLTLLVAFASLLTAVALSRTISSSVITLRNYALSLGQGETQSPLTISRPAEIKDLAEAFNKMTEEIRSREKTLRESEQQFRVLLKNLQSGVALINESGTFEVVNRAFLWMFDLVDDSDIKNVNDRDWNQWQVFDEQGALLNLDDHPVRKTVLTGKPVRDQLVAVKAPNTQTLKWILVSAEPILNPQNKIHRIICTYHDITERKQSEEALRLSEERFRGLLEQAPEGIFLADAQGRYLDVNAAGAQILGYTREEICRLSFADVLAPEEMARIPEAVARLADGTVDRNEWRFKRKDGSFFIGEVVGRLLPDGRLQGILRDVTVQKQAESMLKNLNEELEIRVTERTRELANNMDLLRTETLERILALEALREKEQMLILQSRQAAMGEMIGNISHQWRQPLNILGMQLQQLPLFYDLGQFNKELLEKNVAGSMDIIKHMSKTIDDFRNYFKPDKEKTEFSVHDSINTSLLLLEGNLKNPVIDVEVVAKDDPMIYGYPNEFTQVILNIMNNARDAFIERNVRNPKVYIKIYSEGMCVVVTVADNAGGIPEEIINKVFDPYFTTKGPQQGTGVGLFMSKSIIEKNMGGRLYVRNIADGAEFRIEV